MSIERFTIKDIDKSVYCFYYHYFDDELYVYGVKGSPRWVKAEAFSKAFELYPKHTKAEYFELEPGKLEQIIKAKDELK